MVPELQKKKYDHSSICLLIALVSEVFHCDFFFFFLFTVNDFFRDVEGNMFEDIMQNHVGVSHLLPSTDLAEESGGEDDQIVSESFTNHDLPSGFPQISFCTLKKCSKKKGKKKKIKLLKKKKKTMSLTKRPQRLLRLRPNMLRPAVHKSQHHSSIASRQQSLVSSVSDSERYVHAPVLLY